jgi:HK97 family phage major capsid protein
MSATANAQLRDRLKAVRAAKDEKRSERAQAVKDRDLAKEAFAGTGMDPNASDARGSGEFQDAMAAVGKLGEIDDAIANLEVQENGILSLLGDSAPAEARASGNGPSQIDMSDPRAPWNAHRLLENSDTYAHAKEIGTFTSDAKFGSIMLGQIANRDQFAGFLAASQAIGSPAGTLTTSAAIPPDNRGMLQPALRPLTFLDLIPTGTTDSNMIEYVQVTAVPTGAVEVAELAAKASMGLSTADATAPVRTIAGYVKVARQALDDMAGLATLINTLLPYEVRRRIEGQVLAGNGVGQNLRGIINTSGIAAVGGLAYDNVADAILAGITAIVLSDGDPNFVAMNPILWQQLLTMKADTAGTYLYGTPASLQAPTIWGLTITRNRVIGQNTPLIGDSNAVSLLVREGVNIKVSDSDQDDFTKNRVTILCEARVAAPVWYPAFFAQVDMTA